MNNSVSKILLGRSFRQDGGGGFDPSIYGGLQVFHDTSVLSSITDPVGDVSQLRDLSGLGRNSNQTSSSNRPESGVTTINGNNVVDFISANTDYLNCSNSIRGALSGSANYTIVCVYKTLSPSSRQTLFAMNNGGSTIFAMDHLGATSVGVEGVGSGTISVPVTSNTNPHIFIYQRDGTQRRVIYDGAENTDSSASDQTYNNATVLGRTPQGARRYLNGSIGWFFIYNQVRVDSELNVIGNAAKAKWGNAWVNL